MNLLTKAAQAIRFWMLQPKLSVPTEVATLHDLEAADYAEGAADRLNDWYLEGARRRMLIKVKAGFDRFDQQNKT